MPRFLFPQSVVLFLLPFSTLLTGCGAAKPKDVVILKPPVLGCLDDPQPPLVSDPAEFAAYTLDVWAAGESCRDCCRGYREWGRDVQ